MNHVAMLIAAACGLTAQAWATLPVGQAVAQTSPTSPTVLLAATATEPTDDGSKDVLTPWGHVGADGRGLEAGVNTPLVRAGLDAGSGGGSGSGDAALMRPIDCLVIELDPLTEGLGSVTPGLRNYDVPSAEAIVEGGRYYQECWYVDTGDIFYADVWDQGPPGAPGVNPRVLAQSALSRTPFTAPTPGMAPSMDGEQITGFPSWLWLDPANWVPVEATASAAGVSVTVTATPVRAEWDMGDGTVVECDGPGVVWNPAGPNPDDTDCEHVFQHTSVDGPGGRYAGSVTIVWSIAWRANTGETGTLPEGRSTTPLSLLVNEMQAVVTYDP